MLRAVCVKKLSNQANNSWAEKYSEERPQKHADLLFLTFFYREYLDKLSILKKQALKKSLVIGCGHGVEALEINRSGMDVLATDYSKKALNYVDKFIIKNDIKNFRTLEIDQRNLSEIKEKFDLIVSWSVISYINEFEAKRALYDISNLLTNDGILIILFENQNSSSSNQKGVRKISDKTYYMPKQSMTQPNVEMTFYSSKESKSMLCENFIIKSEANRRISLPPNASFDIVQDIYLCSKK